MSVHRRGLRLPSSQFETLTVKAGILENATYPDEPIKDARTGAMKPDPRAGMKVATIAAALEYGDRQNHPRPFMQTTVARQRDAWRDAIVTLLMRGTDARRALTMTGQVMKEDIQFTITEWPADNSAQWAEQKGFNHGLIWSSHLLKSVESEIET